MEQRPSLLIVDDDADIRELLVVFFEGSGFRVTAVATGAALRRRLADADIVILDAALRGESGVALAAEVRAAGIPVVMITGDYTSMEQLRLLPYPVLHKPFRLAALLSTTMKALFDGHD
jgi:two-component system OmpR family response regulator